MKTIDIQAKEWRDKVNGNSYCAVRVTIDYGMPTEKEFRVPFTYGYSDYYKQIAFETLVTEGYLPAHRYSYTVYCRENGIIVRTNIQRKCLKRDLMAWGKES